MLNKLNKKNKIKIFKLILNYCGTNMKRGETTFIERILFLYEIILQIDSTYKDNIIKELTNKTDLFNIITQILDNNNSNKINKSIVDFVYTYVMHNSNKINVQKIK